MRSWPLAAAAILAVVGVHGGEQPLLHVDADVLEHDVAHEVERAERRQFALRRVGLVLELR